MSQTQINIEIVKELKYLAIPVKSRNCTFIPTVSDLSSKANKANKTMLKLFDTCIVPILLYGSEVWAPFMNHDCIKWEVTQIEKFHTISEKAIRG